MTQSFHLSFWTLFCFSPIPVWHLTLHSFLPSWRRRPAAFYMVCAAEWALFAPFSLHLAYSPDTMFSSPLWCKRICLGVSIMGLLIALWSIKTLTPQRFFVWSVLHPELSKPKLIVTGPYRFLNHPAYLAILMTVAASFGATGKTVVLEALGMISLLLILVIGLEHRELEARLSSSNAPSSPSPEGSALPIARIAGDSK